MEHSLQKVSFLPLFKLVKKIEFLTVDLYISCKYFLPNGYTFSSFKKECCSILILVDNCSGVDCYDSFGFHNRVILCIQFFYVK